MTFDWWTLCLQGINVLVLIWLLRRFFWGPLSGMIEQRRQSVQKTLDDARAQQQQAAAALAAAEAAMATANAAQSTAVEQARATAAVERTVLLQNAAREAQALRESTLAALAQERGKAEAEWADRAGRLAVDIAARLAARLEGAAVRAAFQEWLLREIGNLPPAQRAAAALDVTGLEVISAAPLSATEQHSCREAIVGALGDPARISFKVDPGLIAGLELRGPHLQISNSWRADLDVILSGLIHASRP